ncbi:hypothetical protein ACFOVU_22165 [Nocardiopsis sediminis]|uniref:Cell division protein FtsL n=1 Tax=Nocardiopsis sediminis TaxID=1778267 RepID=A0ABV8FRA6_9ACTN
MSTATETTPGATRTRSTTAAPGRGRTAARPRPAAPATTAAKRPAPAPRAAAPAPAPRMPFVLLVLGLLGGALISLLALRTVLIEDAFAISTLQEQNADLAIQEEGLREDVLAQEAPSNIADEAEGLGMEPGGPPVVLDLPAGEIRGDDTPAPAEP